MVFILKMVVLCDTEWLCEFFQVLWVSSTAHLLRAKFELSLSYLACATEKYAKGPIILAGSVVFSSRTHHA